MTNLSFSAVNLSYTRGQKRLFHKLNFTLHNGDSLHIQGVNGAGKTSLLRLLAGLGEADKGCISWCTQNINRCMSVFRENRLFLGHHNTLNPLLNPVDNLTMSWGMERNIVLSKIVLEEAFLKLGLEPTQNFTQRPCYSLSVGQRRRVALTRLVLSKATLWLLDEPFTALDNDGINIVSHLMKAHLNQGGIIVYSSHLAQDLNSHVCQL